MSMLTEENITDFYACKSHAGYATYSIAIKAEHGGRYPDDWFAKFNASGDMHRLFNSFKAKTLTPVESTVE
jgi:hypothetical protein